MREFEEVTSVIIMQQAGLNPLKQYHSLNARWACETHCCGRLVLRSFNSVKISGFECEYCGTNSSRVYNKNKFEYVRELIESRGGRLISLDYENTFSLVQVKCTRNHLFEIPFYLVQRNRWCPFCGTGKSERITRNIFEQLFGYPFPKRRPRWLVDDHGVRMELDGYCKELQIAFEFQGFQHFLETDVFDVNLTNLQINDNKKIAICKKNGVFLFVMNYETKFEEFPKKISEQATLLGLTLPSHFLETKIEIFKSPKSYRSNYSKFLPHFS